jgi:hypothetical protein
MPLGVCCAYLGCHDALPLGDQRALGADTVPPTAVALVALEGRHHSVVPTARTLGGALVPLRGSQEERRRDGSQHRVLRHEGRHVHAARQTHAAGGPSNGACWPN